MEEITICNGRNHHQYCTIQYSTLQLEEITICNRRGTPSKLLGFSSSEVSSSQKGQCIAEMCSLLLRKNGFFGALQAVTNRNGHTALHLAAMRGHASACAELLRCEAAVRQHLLEIEDVYGMTAAKMAASAGHDDLARLLNELAALSLEEPESRVCENTHAVVTAGGASFVSRKHPSGRARWSLFLELPSFG
eukprot:symbB.v1.2.027526.t1/scaffold2826.1/size69378/4